MKKKFEKDFESDIEKTCEKNPEKDLEKDLEIYNKIKDSEINSQFTTKKITEFEKLHQMESEIQNFEAIEDLKLGVLDYIYYYTGFFHSPEREKKKLIIKKGNHIISSCLDIKYIIQKFYEIEKLKQVVLSEADMDRFANLPKPQLKVVCEQDGEKEKIEIFTNVLSKRVVLQECSKESMRKSQAFVKSLLKKKTRFFAV